MKPPRIMYLGCVLFFAAGVAGVAARDAPLLFVSTLLFVASALIVASLQARYIRHVKVFAGHLAEEEMARRARYFGHLQEQLIVARRIYGPEEYRRTLEEVMESYEGNPDFQRHIDYIRKELESL